MYNLPNKSNVERVFLMTRKSKLMLFGLMVLLLVGLFGTMVFAAGVDFWVQVSPMGSTRAEHSVAVVDGKIYVMGGYDTAASNSVYEYNPQTNIWTTKKSMLVEKYYHQTVTLNNKIYTLGGGDTTGRVYGYLELFDPATNSMTTKTSMLHPRYHFQAVVLNGKIYAIGGTSTTTGSNTVEEYDPVKDIWTEKAPMTTGRYDSQATVVNGKIYVIGGAAGTSGTTPLASVEEYDPSTNTWTTKAPMRNARSNHQAVVIDGKIYAIGGVGTGALNSVEVYDPVKNIWTTKAPMKDARNFCRACVVDGKIYALGGKSTDALSSVEVYDPATDVWTAKPSMNAARYRHQAVVVNNQIFAIGGLASGGMPVNSVERYTPGATPPPVPANLTASAGDTRIKLTWDAVDGASIYNIKRSSTPGGPYTTIDSTSETGITDYAVTNGTTYYYTVSAIVNLVESADSTAASAIPGSTATQPDTPSDPSTETPGDDITTITLDIFMINGQITEYSLTADELDAFLTWYDVKAKPYYIFNVKSDASYKSVKEYIPYDKICSFIVKEQ